MSDAVKFHLGDMVQRRADDNAQKGIVTGILMRPGCYVYFVTWADGGEGNHFDIELQEALEAPTNG